MTAEPSQATQIAGTERETPDDEDNEELALDAPWGQLLRFTPVGVRVNLAGERPFVAGRSESTGLVIQHPQVSNRHFTIQRKLQRAATCTIEDTSSNGTYVNGKRLIKGSPLELPHKALVTLVNSRPKRDNLQFSFVFNDLVKGNSGPNETAKGTDVVGDFFITDEVLGNGSFATVKLAYNMLDASQVAVKVVSKRRFKEETKTKQNLLSEILVLQKLRHPGVVNIYDVEDTIHCVYIFLEYAPDGDLFQYVRRTGRMPDKTAKIYFKQILYAVEYLHAQNIIHRDLKLENVVLLPRKPYHVVKITDFGLAKLIGEVPFVRTICGTPNYIAPEILMSKAYDQKVDCWSLGVILFTILTATMPFDEKEEALLYRKIVHAQFDFLADDIATLDPHAVELVRGLICVDATRRLSVDLALASTWLKDDAEVETIVRQIMESQPPPVVETIVPPANGSREDESTAAAFEALKRKHDGDTPSTSKSPREDINTSSGVAIDDPKRVRTASSGAATTAATTAAAT